MSGLVKFLYRVTEDEALKGADYNTSLSEIPKLPTPKEEEAVEYTYHKEWAKEWTQNLTTYCYKRFVLERQEEEEGSENEEQAVDKEDEEDEDEDVAPESQAPASPVKTSRKKTNKVQDTIPLVEDAIHVVNTISALDLYTKSASLSLCLVEHSTPLRSTKRLTEAILGATSSSFGSAQDDGPLWTSYRKVLGLSVLQLLPRGTMGKFVTGAHRRITIYFYDKHAQAVGRFLDEHGRVANAKDVKLYMRLQNVSAVSIFPNNHKRQHWTLPDTSPYVICIGGKSKIALNDGAHLSFATEDWNLSLAFATPDKVLKECHIDAVPSYSLLSESEPSSISQALRKYHRGQQSRRPVGQLQQPEDQQQSETRQQQAREVRLMRSGENSGTKRTQATSVVTNGETSTAPPASKRTRTEATSLALPLGFHRLNQITSLYQAHEATPLDARHKRYPSATVCGVVLGFTLPTPTKTNQWLVTVSLVDPSLDDALTVCIFRKRPEDLPKLMVAGDLLVIREAGIKQYQDEMQLLGRTTSKIRVVASRTLATTTAIAADGFTRYCQQLWSWGQERLATRPTMKSTSRFRLSELSNLEEPGDSTAMVCGVYETPADHGSFHGMPRGFIRVWDGTGIPSSDSLAVDAPLAHAIDTACGGDPPQEALISLHRTIQELNQSPHCNDATDRLGDVVSVCGQVINVAVWEEPLWRFCQQHLTVGRFVRLRNVSQGIVNNITCIFALDKSWIVPLPNQTLEVRHLFVDHQCRMDRKEPTNPQSGLLPITLPDQKEVTSPPASPQSPENPLKACASSVEGGTYHDCEFSITQVLPDCQGMLAKLTKRHGEEGDLRYQFAISIQHGSDDTQLVALVVGDTGNDVIGYDATDVCKVDRAAGTKLIRNIVSNKAPYKGTVRCKLIDDERYFFLESIEKLGLLV